MASQNYQPMTLGQVGGAQAGDATSSSSSKRTQFSIVETGPFGTSRYRAAFADEAGQPASLWHDIPLYQKKERLTFVCITPRDSSILYDVDKDQPFTPVRLRLRAAWMPNQKVERLGWNYGILPQTWADPGKSYSAEFNAEKPEGLPYNGQLVKVLEVGSRLGKMGEVYQVKPLAAFPVIDQEAQNLGWKIVAIADDDPMAPILQNVGDLRERLPGLLEEIQRWLCTPARSGGGRLVIASACGTPVDAMLAVSAVAQAHRSWQRLRKRQQASASLEAQLLSPATTDSQPRRRVVVEQRLDLSLPAGSPMLPGSGSGADTASPGKKGAEGRGDQEVGNREMVSNRSLRGPFSESDGRGMNRGGRLEQTSSENPEGRGAAAAGPKQKRKSTLTPLLVPEHGNFVPSGGEGTHFKCSPRGSSPGSDTNGRLLTGDTWQDVGTMRWRGESASCQDAETTRRSGAGMPAASPSSDETTAKSWVPPGSHLSPTQRSEVGTGRPQGRSNSAVSTQSRMAELHLEAFVDVNNVSTETKLTNPSKSLGRQVSSPCSVLDCASDDLKGSRRRSTPLWSPPAESVASESDIPIAKVVDSEPGSFRGDGEDPWGSSLGWRVEPRPKQTRAMSDRTSQRRVSFSEFVEVVTFDKDGGAPNIKPPPRRRPGPGSTSPSGSSTASPWAAQWDAQETEVQPSSLKKCFSAPKLLLYTKTGGQASAATQVPCRRGQGQLGNHCFPDPHPTRQAEAREGANTLEEGRHSLHGKTGGKRREAAETTEATELLHFPPDWLHGSTSAARVDRIRQLVQRAGFA